jgi:hypothetical protein
MDLILGNLTTLKAWLLPDTWQSETAKDDVIAQLGRGVAAAMESHCNRRFARVEDETQLFSGSETVLLLPRYPLEEKPTVEVRGEGADTFESAGDWIEGWRENAGIVFLTGQLGTDRAVIRVTYTGGYWVDTSEPEDEDPPTMPEGATAIPHDVVQAWLTQCRHMWTAHKLFANTGTDEGKAAAAPLDLLPVVVEMLAPYRRLTV